MVLVHGLGLSTESWGRVPELLGDAHRVYSYALRGHGASDRGAGGDYSLEAHAEDLRAVLEHALAPGRRAVVVGNSFGGGVILAHAQAHPGHRMAGVVLAGSSGSSVTLPGFPAISLPDPAELALRTGWLHLLRGLAYTASLVGPLEAVANRLVRGAAFAPDEPDEAVDRVRRDFFGTPPEALARTTLTSGARDGRELAPHLKVPALVLHGEQDPQIPAERAEELVETFPEAELVRFPGAGHMLALTHAKEVAEQVARWVRRVGLATGA